MGLLTAFLMQTYFNESIIIILFFLIGRSVFSTCYTRKIIKTMTTRKIIIAMSIRKIIKAMAIRKIIKAMEAMLNWSNDIWSCKKISKKYRFP